MKKRSLLLFPLVLCLFSSCSGNYQGAYYFDGYREKEIDFNEEYLGIEELNYQSPSDSPTSSFYFYVIF